MNKDNNLQRFLDAQAKIYDQALTEIQNGKKKSHWMWFIFPQISGLGFSETSKYYGIEDREEAELYLKHPVLGERLIRICDVLLKLPDNNANRIFGSPDDMKLKSSMTLFASLGNANPVFKDVLKKYFNGLMDNKTLQLI